MRKLMWLAVGFAAATAFGVYLVSGHWLLLLAAFCFAGTVALLLLKQKITKIAALALGGAAAALCWFWCFDTFYLADIRQSDGQTVDLAVEVCEYTVPTSYGSSVEGVATVNGKRCKLRLYTDVFLELSPGDMLHCSAKLKYTAGGGVREPSYLRGEGIFLTGSVKSILRMDRAERVPARYLGAQLRRSLLALIDRTFPADTLGFARALLLGDSSRFTYLEDTAFQISGIRHVIAVSGLHVSILFTLVYSVAGKRRVMTAVLGLPVLLLFAAAAGFTPSITRACVMQGLMILALLLNREYDPPTALAIAVLVMLTVNPLTVTSVSFQLSVGCIVGIFLFSGKISSWLLQEKRMGTGKGRSLRARLTRFIVGSVSVTLGAMTLTTPLCATYFGMVSLVGIVTNLATLWVVSFIFYGIMIACAAGAVWLPLAHGIAWLISWPIRYILVVSKWLSEVPFAAVYTCDVYVVLWLVMCYVLLVAFLFLKKKQPVVLAVCMAVGLVLSLGASRLERACEDYRVTVLDVGQGQCILLQSADETYMVDCGGDYSISVADDACARLLSMGVTRLDGLILTHYDGDHAGAAEFILARIPTARLYLPDISDDAAIRSYLSQAFAADITWVTENMTLSLEQGMIELFPGKNQKSDNESGLCVLFRTEKCDILVTGDRSISAEAELVANADLPEVDILVVGHHGAGNSTGLQLLQTVHPDVAVISAGKDNAYGHPAAETLQRLELFGCKVLRTDQNGTIVFRG